MASRNATPDTFKKVIEAVKTGTIDTKPWMTHRIRFEDLPETFESTIAEPGLIKAIIEL